MTKISIQGSGGGTPLDPGNLKIKNGLPIDATLQTVSDVAGNDSILNISTASVGIGTTTATGLLNLYKAASTVRLMINGDAAQNRLITYRTGGVQRIGLYLNNTAETGSNAGSDFAIRRYTDAGALGGTPLFIKRSTGNVGINTTTPATTLDVNGTANIAERLTIEADSTATTQSTAVIQNTTANSGIALVPNGTGAITADIPDAGIGGGNARGTNVVDLQTERVSADQVAAARNSVIVGGTQNRISAVADYSGILGGNGNVITGQNAVISGGSGNGAGSNFSTVSGGQSNSALTGTHATVVGGQSNVSSGTNSVSGGNANTASGNSSVAMGNGNIASGQDSVAMGNGSTSSAPYSTSFGYNARATGAHSFAAVYAALASGEQAVAFSNGSIASGISSFSINQSNASGLRSFSQGELSRASSTNSSAFGYYSFTNLSEQLSIGRAITYNGDSQYSLLTRNVSTGQVGSGGSYNFSSPDVLKFTNNSFGSGVEQIVFLSVNVVFSPEELTGSVIGLTSHAVFTANYTLAVLFSSTLANNRIVGTPTLERSYSDANMATTSVAFSIDPANGGLVITVTPPIWTGGGTLQWQGTSVLMASQLGVYA